MVRPDDDGLIVLTELRVGCSTRYTCALSFPVSIGVVTRGCCDRQLDSDGSVLASRYTILHFANPLVIEVTTRIYWYASTHDRVPTLHMLTRLLKISRVFPVSCFCPRRHKCLMPASQALFIVAVRIHGSSKSSQCQSLPRQGFTCLIVQRYSVVPEHSA